MNGPESGPAAPEVTVAAESKAAPAVQPRAPRRPSGWNNILAFTVGIVGVAAIAATAFTYADTRREIVRLSTDLAQLRLTLDLLRQGMPTSAGVPGDAAAMADLENRLALLEKNWRTAPAAAAAPVAAAETPTPTADAGDCLPTATRFLVSAGDTWPICNSPAVVDVASVEPGYLTLLDGSVVAAGGNFPLLGSTCMLGVLSAGTAELSNYAEIRVTC